MFQEKLTARPAGKAAIVLPAPSTGQVEKYLKIWDGNAKYAKQQSALDCLFTSVCPLNRRMEDVLIKAAVLNDFYSANIYSIFPIAERIVSLDVDARLASGDETLVSDMGHVTTGGKERYFYSFASKYCAHHQSALFPIYDRYVDAVLRYFRDLDRFMAFSNRELRDYPAFRRVIAAFRRHYGLEAYELKDIDRFLWLLGKEYFPAYPS